jgi:hypothetical protein
LLQSYANCCGSRFAPWLLHSRFPTIAFAGHFSACAVAPVEVARELETEILHQQWSLNKTAPRERVVDSKKLVPEKNPT